MAEIRLGGGQLGVGPAGILVVAVVLLGAGAAYRLGLITTLGYESRDLHNASCVAGTGSGTSLGLKKLPLFADQKIVFVYNAEIEAGSLNIRMFRAQDVLTRDYIHRHDIRESGAGTAEFHVREAGLYKLVIEPSTLGVHRAGTCYKLSYKVTWGFG